jgi:alpha-tubulin suppressor-like RCC1 family protein
VRKLFAGRKLKSRWLTSFFTLVALSLTLVAQNANGSENGHALQSSSGKLSVSESVSCRVSVQDFAECWGTNTWGQLDIPIARSASTKMVVSGWGNYCAIKTDDTAKCWGSNDWGKTALPDELGTVTDISLGYDHSCAVEMSGEVRCWGRNNKNQIQVPSGLGAVSKISAGYQHTCAIKNDQTVSCWGNPYTTSVPSDLGAVASISAGLSHTCAVKTSGVAQCWGGNSHSESSIPGDLGLVKAVTAGEEFTCALKNNGRVHCWGWASIYNQTQVPGDLGNVVNLSSQGNRTCAVREDTTVRCWGDNSSVPSDFGGAAEVSAGRSGTCALTTQGATRCWGRVGSNATPPTELLVQEEPALGAIVQISVGLKNVCAVKVGGQAKCWGNNDSGQNNVPFDLGPITQISAGNDHSCAIKTDQSVKCWGNNDSGQNNVPFDLGPITQISAGYKQSCAIKTNQSVKCWGVHSTGQRAVPLDLGPVKEISLASSHTCAVQTDGQGRCWGDNTYGQTSVPNDLGSISQISAGETSTCSVSIASELRCWGNNMYGQTAVGEGAGPTSMVSVGTRTTCALNLQQIVRCWGDDERLASSSPDFYRFPFPAKHVQVTYTVGGLEVHVSSYGSPNQTDSTEWQITDFATGDVLCQQGLGDPDCVLKNFPKGTDFKLKIFALNEFGSSPYVTTSGRNCPSSDPEIYFTKSFGHPSPESKVRFAGGISNLCNLVPKSILFRYKPATKNWSSWKTYSLSKSNNFSFDRTFGNDSEVEMKAQFGTTTVAAISTQVLVNPKQKFSLTTSRNYVSKFPQGGNLKFKHTAHKNFNGMCTVLAENPYAFNFALTHVGSEQQIKSFRVIRGLGTGSIKMRWNGEVTMTIACYSSAFPQHEYASTRTTVFKARF